MKIGSEFTGHWTEVIGRQCVIQLGTKFSSGFFTKYHPESDRPYEVTVNGKMKRVSKIFVKA